VAAGGSGSQVKHLLGAQFGYEIPAQLELSAAQTWGIPADYVAIAPYTYMSNFTSVVNAMNASGGNMSVAAINDFTRLYHFCDYGEQSTYQKHQAILQAWGQPVATLLYVDAAHSGSGQTGTSSSPGSALFAGGYAVWYTFVDGSGNETTVAQSAAGPVFVPNNNWNVQVQMPTSPAWVATVNFYMAGSTSPSTAAVKSRSVPTSGAGSAQPGQTVYITSLGSGNPPTSNGVPSSTSGAIPILCGYEGGEAVSVPQNVSGQIALNHDVHSHPSRWLNVWTWYATTQLGCQWAPGSGMKFATWLSGWDSPGQPRLFLNDTSEYGIILGIDKVCGQGLANQYATSRGGAPADGQDHNAGAPLASGFNGVQVRNQSTPGYGLQQWIAAGSAVTPVVSSTTPANGASGVSVSTTITVAFSADMNSSTLSLTLNGTSIPLTTYNSGTFTAVFTPSSSLTANTTYSASVDGTSSAGAAMASAYNWSFTTVAPAPTVSSTTPASGATSVAITSTITVVYSEAMNSSSLTLSLQPPGSSSFSVPLTNYNSGTLRATFTPSANLFYATSYTATAQGNSSVGTSMASPYSWGFATAAQPAPTVASTSPGSGATGVALNTSVTVVFSEAMNSATLGMTLNGTSMPLTSYNAGTFTAIFTPSSALTNGTTYAASVNGHSSGGTPMVTPYTLVVHGRRCRADRARRDSGQRFTPGGDQHHIDGDVQRGGQLRLDRLHPDTAGRLRRRGDHVLQLRDARRHVHADIRPGQQHVLHRSRDGDRP
jgi:methionine-rich copper-binding protein CopC